MAERRGINEERTSLEQPAVNVDDLSVHPPTRTREKGHGETEEPEPGWRRTEEVFNDPSTNRVVRVWLDQSGERHYVPEVK